VKEIRGANMLIKNAGRSRHGEQKKQDNDTSDPVVSKRKENGRGGDLLQK